MTWTRPDLSHVSESALRLSTLHCLVTKPGHAGARTGPKASQLVDRLRSATSARSRLAILEAVLIEIWNKSDRRRLTVHPVVRYGLRAFQTSPHIKSVADLSREVGWSCLEPPCRNPCA